MLSIMSRVSRSAVGVSDVSMREADSMVIDVPQCTTAFQGRRVVLLDDNIRFSDGLGRPSYMSGKQMSVSQPLS
jgi:hypothetical protein